MFVLFGFQNRSPAQEHRLDRDNTSRSFCLFLPLFGQAPVIWIARLRSHSFNVNIFIQQDTRTLPHIGGGPADAVKLGITHSFPHAARTISEVTTCPLLEIVIDLTFLWIGRASVR